MAEDEVLRCRALELLRQGMSMRATARVLGVGRNRIRKWRESHEHLRTEGHSALTPPKAPSTRSSKLDHHQEKIAQLLREFPDITAQRIYEEIQKDGYDGGDNIVKSAVRKLRPKQPPKVSLTTPNYEPGMMAESDWSPYDIVFDGKRKRRMHAFGYTLHYSKRRCFSFHDDQRHHSLCDGHVRAFERLGGTTMKCKYDNQKAAILGWEGNQPLYNPRFLTFATYYEFAPVACRPRCPNDKPNVERSFWELERSFLNGRKFRDEADLDRQLIEWMNGVCDPRGRGKRLARFEEERTKLIPLPDHPYDTTRIVYRLCDLEGCIAWDGNRYEVPYEHVVEILVVRVGRIHLRVYGAALQVIAQHELRPKGAGERSRLEGRTKPGAQKRPPDVDQLRPIFAELGDGASEFFEGLVRAHPRSAAHHARRILALRERYSSSDLAAAIRHALAYSSHDHHAIERIVRARATPRRLDEYVAEDTRRRLEEVVMSSATEPRDLDAYDSLALFEQDVKENENRTCKKKIRKQMTALPRPENFDAESSDEPGSSDSRA